MFFHRLRLLFTLNTLRSDTRSISFNIKLYHIYYNFEQVTINIVACFSFIEDSNPTQIHFYKAILNFENLIEDKI